MAQTSRRDFLRMSASTALAVLAGGGLSSFLSACTSVQAPRPQLQPAIASAPEPGLDIEISLRATPAEAQVFPGEATRVWAYRGEVIRGDAGTVQHLPGSYLGPILRLRTGQRVRIRFTNNLPEKSIVHWHGLHVPDSADGHPRLAIGPGQVYTYEFQVANRAGTYWYHPHPHGRTGPQVYSGLAGLLIVSDDEEERAGLPAGEYDVPLVLQDRTFDGRNQFLYLPNGMMDRIHGFVGNRILVNGQPEYVLPVETRAYRLRLLNGSNSRTYKLGWHDGTPLTVIATDGGLLDRPVEREYVTLGPGERVELWADFSGRDVGAELRLLSLPFSGAEVSGMMRGPGMMGGGLMTGGASVLPNGAEFTVLTVHVEREGTGSHALPEQLSESPLLRVEDAVNIHKPRSFEITMRQMTWFLNGRTFRMEHVAEDEVIRLGDTEVWEFVNQDGQMNMIHPMHIHNVQFRVVKREVLPALADVWETVRSGYVDEGWKDTVLLMPGERAKLLMRFEDYAGLYLYHCHNLEHEDMGMMRNFEITA